MESVRDTSSTSGQLQANLILGAALGSTELSSPPISSAIAILTPPYNSTVRYGATLSSLYRDGGRLWSKAGRTLDIFFAHLVIIIRPSLANTTFTPSSPLLLALHLSNLRQAPFSVQLTRSAIRQCRLDVVLCHSPDLRGLSVRLLTLHT